MRWFLFLWNKHSKNLLTVSILFVLFFFYLPNITTKAEAGPCTAQTSGNWTTSSTWTSGCGTSGIPTSGDSVTIGAYTITVNDGASAVGGAISLTTATSQLTVGQGTSGSLSATSIAFGAVANSAGLTINAGASVTLTGAVTLASADANTSAAIAGSGQLSTASMTVGSATTPNSTRTTILTSTISTFTISGAISTTCSNGSSGTRRVDPYINLNSGSMSVGNTITLCNSSNANNNGRAFFQMNQGTQNASLTLSYPTNTIWTMGAGGLATTNLNGTGNTVTYSGATAQVKVTPYNHLILSGTNPNIGALSTINGNLIFSAGSSSSVSTGANITVGGNLQINANNTFTIGNTNTFTITGTTTINGTLTVSTTGATETFTDAVTVNGTLNLTNNTAAKNFSGNVTINNGSTWNNSGNAAVVMGGDLTVNIASPIWGSGVYTMSGTAKNIYAATGVSITIPSLTISGTVTNNLTTTSSNTLTVSTALAGGGTITQATNARLKISGSSGIGTLTATANPNLVTYDGSGAQTIKATTYHNLTYSGSNTGTVNSNVTVNNDLTVSSGNLDISIGTSNTVTVTGTTSVNGTVTISTTTGSKNFGDLTIDNGANMNFTAAGAITMNGSLTINGTGSITGTTGLWTFQDSIGGTIGGTANSASTIANATFTTDYAVNIPFTVSGTLTITGVTLTNNGTLTATTALSGTGGLTQGTNANLTITGTSGITTLTASANGNTVTYNGTSAQTIKAINYYHLNIQPAGTVTETLSVGTYTISGNLVIGNGTNTTVVQATTNDPNIDVAGNFTVNGNATFTGSNLATATLNIDGDLTINSGSPANGTFTAPTGTNATALTLAGNFTNNGTFNHSSATITIDNAAKTTTLLYNSATTFYNLTVTTPNKALVFDSVDQTNISGTITLNGQACGTMVTLSSNSPGTKFSINATGTKNITYVDVTDSTAVTPISITDSKGFNYSGWTFGTTACGSLTLSAPANAAMNPITIAFPAPNSTGNLGTVTANDSRGTNVGWSLTATCTNFTDGGHSIPVTNLTINPDNSTLTAISGSLTGVTAGVSHTFTGTSDPANIITAASGNGTGGYEINPDLSLTVPVGSYWGSYSATITLTVQ